MGLACVSRLVAGRVFRTSTSEFKSYLLLGMRIWVETLEATKCIRTARLRAGGSGWATGWITQFAVARTQRSLHDHGQSTSTRLLHRGRNSPGEMDGLRVESRLLAGWRFLFGRRELEESDVELEAVGGADGVGHGGRVGIGGGGGGSVGLRNTQVAFIFEHLAS